MIADKIILSVLVLMALMILGGCPYKNEILGFLLILSHHTYTTYRLVKTINKSGFFIFENFRLVSLMILSTALVKSSFGYTNGAHILNDTMGMDLNPTFARILVLIIVVVAIVLPQYH